MKSFSNRFKGGLPKGKAQARDTALFPPSQKESFTPGPLPPLPSRRLPPIEQPKPSIGSPTPSIASFESEISSASILSLPHIGDIVRFTTHPTVPEVAGDGCIGAIKGSSRTTTNVSQRSRDWNLRPTSNESRTKNQTLSALTKRSLPSTGNGDLSMNKGSSRSRSTGNGNTNYDDPLRALKTARLRYDIGASIGRPLKPYLDSLTWIESVEEDLGAHLGSSERNRQEVMREIVKSEERYVAELLEMRETFIVPLLHPYAALDATRPMVPTMSMHDDMSQLETPVDSLEPLPIASRFLSSPAAGSDDSESDNSKASMASHAPFQGGQGSMFSVPEHSRLPLASRKPRDALVTLSRSESHRSLQLSPFSNQNAVTTASLSRRSSVEPSPTENDRGRSRQSTSTNPSGRRMPFEKVKKSFTEADLIANGGVAPYKIPDDLRQCLEVIEDTILADHIWLGERLRRRYDKQYPLVRTLADVFVADLHFLRGYADYVLHLERALEQVNDAISTSNSNKRPKNKDKDESLDVSAFLRKLEIDAQDRGEAGLAISLSKPFHRLTKYSRLFQTLLYYTDPWMYEYEGALQLVTKVEDIIRDIEDKIEDAKDQKEKRDKTLDVFARIKGLDKVKQLSDPNPSRVLVAEKVLDAGGSSDVLRSSRKDVWLVVFNDVVLRCQRTGITFLPPGATQSSREYSLFGLQGSSIFATTGHRNSSTVTRPRNLYKFIKIDSWVMANVIQSREGVVEDVVRSSYSVIRPRFIPIPEEDEDRSVYSNDLDCNEEMTLSHRSTNNVGLPKSQVGSQLGLAGHFFQQTESPPRSLYSGSTLASAKSRRRSNSLFSEGLSPSRSTATTPSLRSRCQMRDARSLAGRSTDWV